MTDLTYLQRLLVWSLSHAAAHMRSWACRRSSGGPCGCASLTKKDGSHWWAGWMPVKGRCAMLCGIILAAACGVGFLLPVHRRGVPVAHAGQGGWGGMRTRIMRAGGICRMRLIGKQWDERLAKLRASIRQGYRSGVEIGRP